MLPGALVIAFLLVPIIEIYVILQVGHVIGGWPTVALLLAESLLGAWIVRREGRRAWRALTGTFRQGGLPDRELADAALVLVGGVLLLTPGFVTDVLGFLFVLPFTRPLMRRLGAAYVSRRMRIARTRAAAAGFGGGVDGAEPPPSRHEPPVVRGEVIEEEREPRMNG
jgi:UPF0716 family protein affecting phage T7 exclusion